MNRQILKGIIIGGLFAIPFIPFLVSGSLFFPFITTKAFAFRIIVEIIFASWVVLAILEPRYRPGKSFILYAVLVFLAVIGLADAFGVAPGKSFWSNYERMEGFIALLHLGMFFAVISSVFREIEWKRWWNTSLIASFLMVCYSLFQLAGVLEINQGGVRVDGTLGNASYLAVYMLIHIFIALYFLVRERNKVYRALYGILIGLQLIILYNTATRGALLGLLGGFLITAVLSVRNRESKLMRKLAVGYIVSAIVLVGGFLAVSNADFVRESEVLSRFATISTQELKSGGRSFIWPMAIEGIKERPILGWGQDNFNYVFNEHYSPRMHHLESWFDRAHNIFLDWGIAGGILGLLSYLSLYGVLLFYIWRRSGIFSPADRAILTGLLAAYFFHNFFVFDHLISYILFFSILAFVHSRVSSPVWTDALEKGRNVGMLAAAPVALLLVLALYAANIRPITANALLIDSLRSIQSGDHRAAMASMKRAYERSRLGRQEAVEQISLHAPSILGGDLPMEERNSFFSFVREIVIREAEKYPSDARIQLMAGTFLLKTGQSEEALIYLERARALSPGKQHVRFQIAEVYIQTGEFQKALAVLKEAYEMDTNYGEAQFAYLFGAIYAGDRALEEEMKDVIYGHDQMLMRELQLVGAEGRPIERWVTDDRLIMAYLKMERYADIISLLKRRIERDPSLTQNYVSLAAAYMRAGDRASAIETLRTLAELFPQYKDEALLYIEQIKAGQGF